MSGISLVEILVPGLVFSAIIGQYLYAIMSGTYGPALGKSPANAVVFFKAMRAGWVQQNHMTGQAAVNTTRDYLRVVIYLAGNAIIVASILAGIAVNKYSENNGAEELLMLVKLGACVSLLILIFLLLLMCMRYMLHFSFMINVKEINGKVISKRLMTLLFDHAHYFYSFVPLFAWIFSVWALLVVGVAYFFLIHRMEDIGFMEKEIDEILDIGGEGSELESGMRRLPSDEPTASPLSAGINPLHHRGPAAVA